MKNLQFLSLRSKLSFLIFGLLLSVFSFGFYMTYNFFNLSNKSSINSLNILARSASESIGYNFSENYKDLKTLAGNLNLASLSPQELQNKLNQAISWHDNWDLILVVDPQGNYISSSTFDKNGKSVELESLRTQHYNESAWFRSVINKQFSEESSKNLKGVFVEEFIQDSILSTAFKESRYATSFSAVVTNSANQVVAVVTARANAQWIKRSLQNYFETTQSNYADVEFSVLNRDLRAIVEFSSAGSGNSESNSKDYANLNIQIEERDKTNIKINKLNQLNGPGEGSIQIPGRKGLTLFSIETINSKNLLSFFNWKMLVKQPSSEFFSKHNEAGFWALMFFIGFMIFAILGSLFIVHSFNHNLQTLASDLTLASNDITTSSFNINDSTERNSRNSQNQFGSLETISNSISHVSSTVQENISLAENATHLSDEINHLTVDTQKAMSELKQAMKSIHDSNQRIEALVKIIEEIGEKTEIIDDIVFKTQLLSFNASVEAERAGEHGRGFSVVAQEVGNLAQLSGKAATEIAGIVKNSIREANLVSKENKNRVEVGEELTKTTSSKLESVTQKLSNIFDITEKIATASKGQGSGLDQVAQELISVTQQLKSEAHNTSEHSKNVEELEKQSKKLLAVIDKIKYIAKAS